MYPVRRVQYQHLHLNRNKTLHRVRKFQKVRIMLLKSMSKLSIHIQKTSKMSLSKEVFESFCQYINWSFNCLELLRIRKYSISECNRPTSSLILNKFFLSINKVLRDNENNQKAASAKGIKLEIRRKLVGLLTENIKILQHAIEMLKHFMKAQSNFRCKQKANKLNSEKIQCMNYVKNINIQHSNEESLKTMTVNENEESENQDKTLPEPFKISLRQIINRRQAGGKDSSISLSMHADRDLRLSSFNAAAITGDYRKMDEMAGKIIDNLFMRNPFLKSSKDSGSQTQLNSINYDHLDALWESLINELNQMLRSNNASTKVMKEDLKKVYLRKMQILLKDCIKNTKELKRSTAPRRSQFQASDIQPKDPTSRSYRMHRHLFHTQLRLLKRTSLDSTIRRIYKLIMAEEIPRNWSDQKLFEDYKHDSHYYNIRMLMIYSDTDEEGLLGAIENNFEKIMSLEARKNRHFNMARLSSFHNRIMDQQSFYKNVPPSSSLVMDADFFKEERAKWTKYFAELETTTAIKMPRRPRKLNNKVRPRSGRNITDLYTAPRVTNRLRQAINQINEDALQTTPKLKNKNTNFKSIQTNTKPLPKAHEGPLIADMILRPGSWTSCCSKCKSRHDDIPVDSALGRYFRTHNQIQFLTNELVCNCNNDDSLTKT